jgi:LysM repeat protein
MRLRLWLLAMVSLAASLACNLGTPPRPTPTRRATLSLTDAASTSVVLQPTFQSTTQSTPNCTPRTDWPTMTVASGDTLSSIAARVGVSVDDLAAANCLGDANALVAGQTLYVPVALPGGNNNPTPGGDQNCGANQWFFRFNAGKTDPYCPGAVITSSAAGENFEGGRVYWYEAMPGAADTRGTIYVIYNDGSWETFVDTWDASQPSNDPGIIPPANRYQPERGIGKLWREQAAVRRRLGWAYEPESAFTGRRQAPIGNPGQPYTYIDHGWRNLALRLYTANSGLNRWEVAGYY